MRLNIIFLILAFSIFGKASFLEDFKMERRFGIGLAVGGPYSKMGIETEFNLSPDWSLSGGVGRGENYSSFATKGKYFLLGDQVSPYFLLGLARWWSSGTNSGEISPSVLKNIFLAGEDTSQGFSVWTVYPGIGVQFVHDTGFSCYFEAHYLFKIPNFSNGTYAGLGMSWFF